VIISEIMSYHKQKEKPRINFDFRPVPKSEMKVPSPRTNKTSADLLEMAMSMTKTINSTTEQHPLSSAVKAEQCEKVTSKLKETKVTPVQMSLVPIENDIIMLSAKLSATKVEEMSEQKDTIISSHPDVDMLSAKLSATKVDEISEQKDTVLSSQSDVDMQRAKTTNELEKPIDVKAALKIALLNARLARMKGGKLSIEDLV